MPEKTNEKGKKWQKHIIKFVWKKNEILQKLKWKLSEKQLKFDRKNKWRLGKHENQIKFVWIKNWNISKTQMKTVRKTFEVWQKKTNEKEEKWLKNQIKFVRKKNEIFPKLNIWKKQMKKEKNDRKIK